MVNPDGRIPLRDAAKLYGVPRGTLSNAAMYGILPAVKIKVKGRKGANMTYFVYPKDVEEFRDQKLQEKQTSKEVKDLREVIRRQRSEVNRLRKALEDFAQHGTRFNLVPTVELKIVDSQAFTPVSGLYSYLRVIDKSVRERAERVLRGEE